MLLKLARELDHAKSYYDHVPGSTAAGTVVGGINGLGMGVLGGATAGRALVAGRAFAKVNEESLQGLANSTGIKGVNVKKIVDAVPSRKKIIGIGTGVGLGLGMVDGAYRGSMTGVGMNDRQYIKGKDIGVKDVVYNSRMAAIDMNSSRGRLSNVYNDNFGRAVGGLRRMKMGNQKNNEIMGDA